MIWILISFFGLATTLFTSYIPMLLKYFFMIEIFIVKNRDIMENISERIASTGWCATWRVSSKQIPSGFCFMTLKGGNIVWFWIGNSGHESDMTDFFVICNKTIFNIISKPRQDCINSIDDINDCETDAQNFCIVNRSGPYNWISYSDGIVPWVPETRDWQIDAVDTIISTYKSRTNNKNVIVFISSPPGKGKTTVAMQVAKQLDARFCKSFNPTDPGDSLSILIRETRPTADSPLVILFDEVDQILLSLHTNMITMHKNVHTQVKNKCGWNTLLDDIANQTKYVILIMTSNMSMNLITTMLDNDSSYMREGRVHLCIEQFA